MPIYFYGDQGPYGCFSNFSRHGFIHQDEWWATGEHYYQAQKYAGTEYADLIRMVDTPKQAAKLGRSKDWPLRPDWETVKEDVMRVATRRKFESVARIRAILLSTGDEILIEDSPIDWYWGVGIDRTGQNRMGVILMEIRAELRDK